MIDADILSKVRNSVCAIGFSTVPMERLIEDIKRPYFKVVGTGFLVSDEIVMTNRHVIQGLMAQQEEDGFPKDQLILMFVHPTTPTKWQIDVCRIHGMGFVANPNIDVGMVEFTRPGTKEFHELKPAEFALDKTYSISEPVALCGYPYGHSMLQRDGNVYRWGPVLQQGYISAISPFDNTGKPDELLLDIRIAGGMSGAPVIRPSDGKVIGIVHSAWESTTALAFPLDKDKFEDLLRQHNEKKTK